MGGVGDFEMIGPERQASLNGVTPPRRTPKNTALEIIAGHFTPS